VPIEWTTVIEGGIPILGGLYATALGYGAVSRSQPQPSPPVLKTRSLFRWLGPLVFLFGCFAGFMLHTIEYGDGDCQYFRVWDNGILYGA